MKCEAEGKIIKELDVKNGKSASGKDWERREYLLRTRDVYPKNIKFAIMSFDGPILNPLKVDDQVRIHFTVEANEYQGKYYNDVRAYKIETIVTQ